jgi:hypothetical protein
MLFNSLYFLVFLLIVLVTYHAVLRSFAVRKLFLLRRAGPSMRAGARASCSS